MNIAVICDNEIQYSYKGCDITFFTSESEVNPDFWVSYDAAFLVEPVSEIAVKRWTGHPHIRFVSSIDELNEEIEYLFTGIECEIKLLIKIPDKSVLKNFSAYKADIEQIYLEGEEGSHRIRKRVMGDTVIYNETIKMRINPAVSKEFDTRIDEYGYNELSKKADKEKHPIIKSRYCFFYKKQYFELDKYDFWDNKCTLELELKDENDEYELPPEIEVIKDVTDDKRYKNSKLAGVSYEDYKAGVL